MHLTILGFDEVRDPWLRLFGPSSRKDCTRSFQFYPEQMKESVIFSVHNQGQIMQ
jgi:hypothetical protein